MLFTPASPTPSRKAWSLNRSLSRAWQSSKCPVTASAWTLAAGGVVIWRRWTSDTRPCGYMMNTSTLSMPRKASIAADPVSPEVAPTMVIRWPDRVRAIWNSCAINCIAKSLKASVGPWNSSSR